MKLWKRYVAFLTCIVFVTSVYFLCCRVWTKNEPEKGGGNFDHYYYQELIRFLANERHRGLREIRYDECSMSRCFNFTKCLWNEPKVYVYPTQPDVVISPVYEKILRAIRDSIYYTEQPEDACLFVLSLDTTDRDRISDNYIEDLSARIDQLSPEMWNEGRNHLIFNLYYGSYPDYSQRDIGFLSKNAIVAWASANSATFRKNFDISFPLFHKEHPVRVAPQKLISRNPNTDLYLSSFKGKRYVYGIGSHTRDSLYHLHNRNSTIILTTCRHNTDWKKFEDSRCAQDNREYNDYDYVHLLGNSSFCLTPRGRRLGSFRFLEALKAGCIPVILSDGWELPFGEIIDWSQAAIQFHERAVFFTTDMLNSISTQRIARMKLQTQLVYHRYFASVDKIVLGTLQIIFDRLKVASMSSESFIHPIDSGLAGFTAILQVSRKLTNRMVRIVDMLAGEEQIKRFIVLWPRTRGTPPERSAFAIKQQIRFVEVNDLSQESILDLDQQNFIGEFLLMLDERVKFTREMVVKLMDAVQRAPSRLVTYHALSHQEHEHTGQTLMKKLANYTVTSATRSHSIALLHFAALHRSFHIAYAQDATVSAVLKHVAVTIPQCPVVLFNVFMVEQTLQPPILLVTDNVDRNQNGVLPIFVKQSLKHYGQCLNKLMRTGYEESIVPLMTSTFRHL